MRAGPGRKVKDLEIAYYTLFANSAADWCCQLLISHSETHNLLSRGFSLMKFRPDVGAVAKEELKASAQGQVCLHTREQAPEAALVPPKQAETIGRRG